MADTKAPTKRTATSRPAEKIWSEEERAAMQESARERKAASRRDPVEERAVGERDIREKIAGMPSPDREMAERVHQLVTSTAPDLMPRTYYGMPAYARNGRIVCFFKPASKFRERYATFAFDQAAHLDEGTMWPKEYALTALNPETEARITELVRRAVS